MSNRRNEKRRLIPLHTPQSSQYKFSMAATMRSNPTPAEDRMWQILTKEVVPRFPDHQFRKQQVVFGYIADFFCETLRLCIEVDGPVHDDAREYDQHRDNLLRQKGLRVLRVRNDDVFGNPRRVAARICDLIEALTTP